METIPPYSVSTTAAASIDDDLYAFYVMRLVLCGQHAYRTSSSISSSLAGEVAEMTQGQVWFEMSAKQDDRSYGKTSAKLKHSITFPVLWDQVVYGRLHVLISSSLNGGPYVSLHVAQRVAHVCGWLLRTLEDAAFVMRRRAELAGSSTHELADLTSRQRQVLRLMILGYPTAEIAELLTLSKRTVEKHQQAIYFRLNVNSQSEAIIVGLTNPSWSSQ